MKSNLDSVKSPLQMAGFYLAWIETALAAGLWPLKENDALLAILLYAVVSIALIFALGVVFILVYLVRHNPRWLFNPSDYDPSVQDELIFGRDCSVSTAGKRTEKLSQKLISGKGNVNSDESKRL